MRITTHYALWQCKYYYMEMLNRLYRLPIRAQANKRSRISLCSAAVARSLPNVIGNRIKFTVILRTIAYFLFHIIKLANYISASPYERTEKMEDGDEGTEEEGEKNEINAKWDLEDSVCYY